MPDEQRVFLSQGYVGLEGLWSIAFASALSREAGELMRTARPPGGRPRPPVVSSRSPSSQTTVADAPLLACLHFALVGSARALTGRMLVPAYAVFNYYAADDGVWLHVDTEGCELTLLTTVLGNVGPLHLHPELLGVSSERLEALEDTPGWDPNSGSLVEYPHLGALAHRGDTVPHHRPGRTVAEPSAVAALHYRSLF